jgi:hypothetical protein
MVAEGGDPILLPYVDIEDLHDHDYTLTLTDHTGAAFELTMLGRAYGQVLAEVAKRRDELLERHLLLRGVDLQDTIPGKLFGGREPDPVQVRLYRDLLVVIPERGTMFGIPFSFIDRVTWDEELYQLHVATDDGSEVVLGHLGRRSEELRDELGRLMDALARRTAQTLEALLPGTDPAMLGRLAAVMRDGRATQQREVDAIDPALWPALEGAVAGTEDLRRAYEHLKGLTPPGWAAFGVKAVLSGPEEATEPPAEAEPAPPEKVTDLWYFCPLSRDGGPANAVAHEVTSESGHATYVFRLMEADRFAALSGEALAREVTRSIRRLNRALLQLNFRREPIYLPEEEIAAGPHARYRVALRKLDHLRWARESFLGRAIHNATWARQVDALLAGA